MKCCKNETTLLVDHCWAAVALRASSKSIRSVKRLSKPSTTSINLRVGIHHEIKEIFPGELRIAIFLEFFTFFRTIFPFKISKQNLAQISMVISIGRKK